MNTEYEIGQNFVSNKNGCFYNTEDKLIDIKIGDSLYINDFMDGSDDTIMYYLVLVGDSDIEIRMMKEEIDELVE